MVEVFSPKESVALLPVFSVILMGSISRYS